MKTIHEQYEEISKAWQGLIDAVLDEPLVKWIDSHLYIVMMAMIAILAILFAIEISA